jgi:hypothetical protein
MKLKFNLLYNNGHTEEFEQEGKKEEIDSILNTIAESFTNGLNASVRFSDGKVTRLIRVAEISRVNFKKVDES